MQEKIDKFMQDSFKEIEERPLELKKNLLELSYLTMAAAASKKKTYRAYMRMMNDILKDPSLDKGTVIWMLGRIAMAAKLAEDNSTLDAILYRLQTHVKKFGGNDVYTGWAISYLAEVNDDFYKYYKSYLSYYINLSCANHKQKPDDVFLRDVYFWMLVGGIYAASGRDFENYSALLHELKERLPNRSLKECSTLVSSEHLGNFMVSHLRHAFFRMKDSASYKELPLIHLKEITSFDSLLCVVAEMRTQSFLEVHRKSKASQNPNGLHHHPSTTATKPAEQNCDSSKHAPGPK